MSKQKLPAKFLVINVDSDVIKICHVSKKKDSVTVHEAITVKTPEFSYEDGVLKDLPNIVKAIHEALGKSKIKTRDVVFSISSTKVLTKEVTVPYMSGDDKIMSLIRANAGEYFPVATEDCVYAYSVLETFDTENDGKKQKMMRFIAYAVVNDIVNSRYELAKQLDLKVASVDYSGNSIAQLSRLQISEEPTMALLLKEESTVISTFRNKALSMQRTLLVGVGNIINAVAASYSITYDEAKKTMQRMNIAEIADAKPAVKEAIEDYFTSVQRIKEFYRRTFADQPLTNICIMGEGSDYEGFEDLFSSYMAVPSRKITSLNGVVSEIAAPADVAERSEIFDPNKELIKYIEVIGAAIDPLGLVSKELEGQVRDKSRNNKYRLFIMVAVLAAIVLVAIPLIKYFDLKGQKDTLEQDIKRLEVENEKVTILRKESDRLDVYFDDLKEFDKNTFAPANYAYEFVEALEAALPKECVLNTLSIAENGTATMSFETDNYITLIKYIMQMKSIANVDDEWVNTASAIKKGETADGNGEDVITGIAVDASCILSPGNVFYLNTDKAADALAAK